MATVETATASFEIEDLSVPFSLPQDAWASYKKYRPEYPQSMFDLWFDYHRQHGGKFDAAHDVGAGTHPTIPTPSRSLTNTPRRRHPLREAR